MDKIKVLQVNKLYCPATGGIERVVQYIAEGLIDEADIEVLVCQRKGKGVRETVNGIRVCRSGSIGTLFSMPVSFSFVGNLRRMAKGRDIIQFHMPFPLGDLGCLLSGYKGKVVVWWHSDVVKQEKFMLFYRPVMRRFLERADLILTASQGIIDGSLYLGPYRDKCKVIPLAVNQDILEDGRRYLNSREVSGDSESQERALLKSNGRIKFLFIGRFVYYKGCSILLEAMAHVPQGELTLVGGGPMEGELREACRELGIEDRVHFAGHVSDEGMKRFLSETDVFVLPSIARSEAFGIVQLEAMSYGKPVINTNLPSGVPDVSLDGTTGVTVAPNDVDGLAAAMNDLATHPEKRERMGRMARRRVEDNFTLEKVLPQIYSAYRDVLIGKAV